MKKRLIFMTIIALLFISSINAQKGFRIEVGIGPTTGDSREYFSYTLLGNFYYLWKVSDNITIGPTTGVLVFLGDGNYTSGSNCFFCSIPDVYIPIAIASRVDISKEFTLGTDIGYGISANTINEGGGFYFRPNITYNLKEKFALIGSYSNINEKGGSASTISLGLNFGF